MLRTQAQHKLSTWHDAGAHPTDVRMTTRFKEHDLTEGLTGAIHETGHSLYEQVWGSCYEVKSLCLGAKQV